MQMETTLIGAKITEARKKMNLSQATLAERLFISSQAVGKWERGESMPDITTFIRLAEILGVDLNYFSQNFQSTLENQIEAKETEEKFPKQEPLRWDMSSGNWVDADFSGLKNSQDKFSASNLKNSLFIGSELAHVQLNSNHIENCNFTDTDFTSSMFQSANLTKNQFVNCQFTAAKFSSCNLDTCDFSAANLTGATFDSSSISKNLFSNALLKQTTFKHAGLTDLKFEGIIDNCVFDTCYFKRVTFENATLVNTFFKSKSVKKINFINCKTDRMTYAFLKNSNANLSGTIVISED